jgi:hypothetical protein
VSLPEELLANSVTSGARDSELGPGAQRAVVRLRAWISWAEYVKSETADLAEEQERELSLACRRLGELLDLA